LVFLIVLLAAPAAALADPSASPEPHFTRDHEDYVNSVSSRVREVRGLANDVERFAAFTDDSIDKLEQEIEELAAEGVHKGLTRALDELSRLTTAGPLPPPLAAAADELRTLIASGHAEHSHNTDVHLEDKVRRLQALRRVESALRGALAAHGSVPVQNAAALVSVALREHAAGTAEELIANAHAQAETQQKRARRGFNATGSGADAVIAPEYAAQMVLLRDLAKVLRDEAVAADAAADSRPAAGAGARVNEELTTTATQEKVAQVDALLASLARGVQSKPVREAEAFIQDVRDSLAGAAQRGAATARETIDSFLYRAMHYLVKAPAHKDIDVALDLIEKVLHRGQAVAGYAPGRYEVSQQMVADAETLLSQLPQQTGHIHAARALLRVAMRGEAIENARHSLEHSITEHEHAGGSSGGGGSGRGGDGSVRASLDPAAAAAVREAQAKLHEILVTSQQQQKERKEQQEEEQHRKSGSAGPDADVFSDTERELHASQQRERLTQLSEVRRLLSYPGVAALAGAHIMELLTDIERRISEGSAGDDEAVAAAQDDDSIDPFTGEKLPASELYADRSVRGGGGGGGAGSTGVHAPGHEGSAPLDDADAADARALDAVKYARAAVDMVLPSAEHGGALEAHSEAINMAANELHFAQRSVAKRRSDRLAYSAEADRSAGGSPGAHAAALRLSSAQTVNHLEQAAKHLSNAGKPLSGSAAGGKQQQPSSSAAAGGWSDEQLAALKNAEASVLEALYAAQEGLVMLTHAEEQSPEAQAARDAQALEDREMVDKLVLSAEESLARVQAIDPRVQRAQEILAALAEPGREIGDAERQVNIDNAERLLAEAAVAHASPEVQIALHDLATFAELRDLENAKQALLHAPQTLEVVAALHDIEEAKLDMHQPGRSPLGATRERIRRAHGVLIQVEKDMNNVANASVRTDHAARFLESVGARMEQLAERGLEHPSQLGEHDKELVEAAALVDALHDVDELDKARDMLGKLEDLRLLRMRPADRRALLRELEARLSAAEQTVATRRAQRLVAKQEEHDAIDAAMDKLRAQAREASDDPDLLKAVDDLHTLQEKLHEDFRAGKDLTHREDGHGMGDGNDKDGDGEPDTVSFVTHRAQDFVDSVRGHLYGEHESPEQMEARELLEVDEILREVKPLHRGTAKGASPHDDLAMALTAVEELRIAKVRHHSDSSHRARIAALQRLASLISRTAQRLDHADQSDAFLLSRAERLARKALTEERVAEAALEVHELRTAHRAPGKEATAQEAAALRSAEGKLRAAQALAASGGGNTGAGGGGDVAKLLDSVRADLERASVPVPLQEMVRLAALDALREAQKHGARPQEELQQALRDLTVIGDSTATREARAVLDGALAALSARGHADDVHARHAADSLDAQQVRELLERAAERLDADPRAHGKGSREEQRRVRRAQLLIDMAEAEKAIEAALELLQPIGAGEKAIGRAVKMLTEVYSELDQNMGGDGDLATDEADTAVSAAAKQKAQAGRAEVLRELDQALGDIAMAPVDVQESADVLRAERLVRNAYTVLVRHHHTPGAVFYPKTPSFRRRRDLERRRDGVSASSSAGEDADKLAHVESLMQQLKELPTLPDGKVSGAARRRELQRSQLLEELERTAEDIRARRPGDQARRLVLPARVSDRDLGLGLEINANMTCAHLPGHHLAGKQCVPDSVCTATTCNHHGLCSIVSGSVHCLCDAGFASEGSRFCSKCTARSATYPDCFTRELTDDFVRDALSADACTAPLMPTSLNAPGLLHSAQRTVHVQEQYFINTAANTHSTHLVVEEESLLRVHVFAEHGDLLQSSRTIKLKLALLDSKTVIHEGSLFFGEQESVLAAILAPGVSYALVFEYDGNEIQRRAQAAGRTCPTMRVDVAVTPASKLQQYGETAVDDAMSSRLTADPTLTHQGTNRNPIAPGDVIADGVMGGDLDPSEAAAVAAGHGACKSRPHIPTFPTDADGVFDVPPLGFHKDEQLAFMTGDAGRGGETDHGKKSAGSDGQQVEQVVYMLTFDIPHVHQRQAFIEAYVDFNFVYGDLRMMLRNAASELLYLATPAMNGNSIRIPVGPGRYSLTVLLLRPAPAPVPELPFNLPHVNGAAAEHAVTLPECMLYTFRFHADFVATPELPAGERLTAEDILTEDCGYNQLPPHLNVPSLLGYHGNNVHFFDTFRYDPIRLMRYTHFEVREPSLVRIFVPHDSNHQGVEVRLVHLDAAANATHAAQFGGAHAREDAEGRALGWGDGLEDLSAEFSGYDEFENPYDDEEGVETQRNNIKVMRHDEGGEVALAHRFRRAKGVQKSDSLDTGAAHHSERGRDSRARASLHSRVISLGIVSRRHKSEWIVATVAPGAYRLDFRVSPSRFLPLTEAKCEGFSMELSIQPESRADQMSDAACSSTAAHAPEIPSEVADGTHVLGARAGAHTVRPRTGTADKARETLGYSFAARVPREDWKAEKPVASWEFWVKALPEGQNGLVLDLELEYDFTRVPLIAYLEESLDPADKAVAEAAVLEHARRRAEDEFGEDYADAGARNASASAQRKSSMELADELLESVGKDAQARRTDGVPATVIDRNYQTMRRKLKPGFYRLALYLLAPYAFNTVGDDTGRPGPLDDVACVEYDLRLRFLSPKEEPFIARCLERSPLRPGLMRLPSSLTSMRFLGSDMLATQTHVQGRFFFPHMQRTPHSLQEHLDAIDADQSHALPTATEAAAALAKMPRGTHRVEVVVPAVAMLRMAIDAIGVPLTVTLRRILCLSHPGQPLSKQDDGSATRVEPWIKYDMHRAMARRKTAEGCVETVFSSQQGMFSTVRFLDPGLYELVLEQPPQTVADDAHDAADCLGMSLQLALSAVHAMEAPDVLPERIFRGDSESGQYARWEHKNRRERDRDVNDDDEYVDDGFLADEERRRELGIHPNFRPHALLSDLARFRDFIPLCPVTGSDHAPPAPPPKLESFYIYDSVRRNEHLHLQQRYNEPRSYSMRFHTDHSFRLYARVAFPFLTSHLVLTLTSISDDGLTEYLGEARFNRHVLAVDVAHPGEWILTIADAPHAAADELKHQGLFCSWFTFRLEIEPLPLSGAGPYGGLLPAALNIPPLNLLMSSLERVLPRFSPVPATLNSPAMLVPHHAFHHFAAYSLLPPARRTGTAAHVQAGYKRNEMRFRILHRSLVRLMVTPAVRPFLDAHFGVKIILDCEACNPVAVGKDVTVHTTRHYSWLFGELDIGDYVLTLEPKTSLMPHTWFLQRGAMDVLFEMAVAPVAHILTGIDDLPFEHHSGLHHAAPAPRGRTPDGRFALPSSGPCSKVLKEQSFHVCAHAESMFIQREHAPHDSLSLHHEFALCPELHGRRVHTVTLALREQSTVGLALYYDFLMTSLMPTLTDVVNGHRWHGERMLNSYQLFAVLPAGYYNLTVDSLGARAGALLTDACLRDTYGLTLQISPVRPDTEAADAATQYQSWAKAQKLAHVQRKHNIPAAALTTTTDADPGSFAHARNEAGPNVATPAERAQIHARIAMLRSSKAAAADEPGSAASLALSPVLQSFHADAADEQILKALANGAACPNPAIPPMLFPREATVVVTSPDGQQGQVRKRTWRPRAHSALAQRHVAQEQHRRVHVGVSHEGESAEEAAEFAAEAEAATVNALALAYTPGFAARLSMPYVRAFPGDHAAGAGTGDWEAANDASAGPLGEASPVRTVGLDVLEESLLFVDIRAYSADVRERGTHVWSVAADGVRHESEDERDASYALPDDITGVHTGIDLLPRLSYEFNRGPRHQKIFWLPPTFKRARRGWHQFELELAVTHPEDARLGDAEGGQGGAVQCHLYALEVAVVPVTALQDHLFRPGCLQRLPPAHIPFDDRGRGLVSLPDGVWHSGLVDEDNAAAGEDNSDMLRGKTFRMRLHVMEDSVVSAQLRFSFVTASFRLVVYRIEDDGEAYEFARARNVPAVAPGRHEVPLGAALAYDQALDLSLRLPQGNYHVEIQEQMATAMHEILGRIARARSKFNGASPATQVDVALLTAKPLCVPFSFFFEMTPVVLAREHGMATHLVMQRIAAEAQQLAAAAAANGGVLPGGGPTGSLFSHGESVCQVESCGCRNTDVFSHSRHTASGSVSVPMAQLPPGTRPDQCVVAGSCTPLASAAAKRSAFVCHCAREFAGARCERCAHGYAGYPTCMPLPTQLEEEERAADARAEEIEAKANEAEMKLLTEWQDIDSTASSSSSVANSSTSTGSSSSGTNSAAAGAKRGGVRVDTHANGTTVTHLPTSIDIDAAFSNPFVVPFDIHELSIGADLKKNLVGEEQLPPTHPADLVSTRTGRRYRPAVTVPTTPGHMRDRASRTPLTDPSGAAGGHIGDKLLPGQAFTSEPGVQRRIHCSKPCYRGRCDYATGRCVSDVDARAPAATDTSSGHGGIGADHDAAAADTKSTDVTPQSLLQTERIRVLVDPRESVADRMLRALFYVAAAVVIVLLCCVAGLFALGRGPSGAYRWPTSATGWLTLAAAGTAAAARHVFQGAAWAFEASGARRATRAAARRVGIPVGPDSADRATLLQRNALPPKPLGFGNGPAARHAGVTFGECTTAKDELSLDDDQSEMETGRIRRTGTGNGAAGAAIARALQ
jgi:hypothetical protein